MYTAQNAIWNLKNSLETWIDSVALICSTFVLLASSSTLEKDTEPKEILLSNVTSPDVLYILQM